MSNFYEKIKESAGERRGAPLRGAGFKRFKGCSGFRGEGIAASQR